MSRSKILNHIIRNTLRCLLLLILGFLSYILPTDGHAQNPSYAELFNLTGGQYLVFNDHERFFYVAGMLDMEAYLWTNKFLPELLRDKSVDYPTSGIEFCIIGSDLNAKDFTDLFDDFLARNPAKLGQPAVALFLEAITESINDGTCSKLVEQQ